MEATGRSKYPTEATLEPAQNHRLQRTLEAARLLQSTLDLPELTRIILEIVRNEVPVDRVTAFAVDRKRNFVHSLAAQGVNEQMISMPIGEGIAGFVAQTRQAVDIEDVYADSRFKPEFDKQLNYKTHNILALPVLNNCGEVAGVLELLNRKKPITQDDREFLQDISSFIGLALENAWLHEELRNKAHLENELAQARERLAQLARFSLMHEVLSTVAEKLISPLTIVKNHAALLIEDQSLSTQNLRYADIIERSAESSMEAVKGFLGFIDQSMDERTTVNVTDLVRQMIAVRAANWVCEGINAKEDLQPTPPVIANAAEIQQAVMNLIKNAEDAMAANNGPRVLAVRTHYDSIKKAFCICIGYNGSGIAGQNYERIFEPFFSTKRGRTGLGLTIANRIIQEHHGQILFDTNSDGTVFSIELPPR